MRIIIFGSGSFIARAVIDACKVTGMEHISLSHDEDLEAVLQPGDRLLNFAIDPRYRSDPYSEDRDRDLRAARAAASKGSHFVMLSTRRVYGAEGRWNAVETSGAEGDETAYGRNKAISEKAVQRACDGTAGIFRLSNIFGYEYSSPAPRRSFLGQLLYTLKQQGKIFFDMHPATRRDFLPVEICANLLAARAADATAGTYNLGSGLPIACCELAGWIMEGFGRGELVCDPMIIKDEFFLNMKQWRSHFGFSVEEKMMRAYCVGLGRRLECERS